MKRQLSLFVVLLSVTILSFAQRGDNKILLKSGMIRSQNDFSVRMNAAIPSADIFNSYYYRLIQFSNVPGAEQKRQIEATGIKLVGYVPYNSFYIAIPAGYNLSQLLQFNPRTLIRLQSNDKINNQLRYGDYDYARKKTGTVDLVFQYFKNISADKIKQQLVSKGCVILSESPATCQFTIRADESKLNSLIEVPYLEYLQPIAPDPVPDDTKGRSLHRSNAINTDYSSGRHWDGSGVSIALADDGIVGPHIDFTGRLTNLTTTPGGFHGDMTSGIAVGAGNLNPVYRGMATGSHLYVFDIGTYPQIVDAANNLTNYGTTVVSTSYSQGCNDYDTYSQQGDQIMHDLKIVQPVFSAGNSNGVDCNYGAGTQWGNITGGYKQGKNVIACANLDSLEILDITSSHGPAADGRIKPDISSNGAGEMSTDENNLYQIGGGTSAACPGVAGVCAQLYQAYRTITGNPNPEAPLIKACILNTAEDIGNAGPDFKYGYGRINALRAVQTLENNHYLSDSVNQGDTRTHNIIVPAGTTNLRVMVLWLDEPGDASAAIALINDIDITVTDPSSNVFNPWVLDPTPNAVTLDNPAVRGVDTLNNMEQVTIDNPPAGTYTVTVNGTSIPLGPQKYYLVYEFRTDVPTLTYPIGGEGFVPGETEILRWDAFGSTGTFTLEYSTDNASSWNLISNTVPADVRQYQWTVPSTTSGLVYVRISRGVNSDMNDAPFTIIGVPTGLTVNYSCPDTLQLSWNAVANAIGYEVSQLGAMYMDSVASVAGTSVLLPVNSTVDTWFSVKAITNNNGKGRRAIAIHKTPGLINCSLALDAGVDSILSPASGIQFPCTPLNSVPVIVRIHNGGISALTNFDVSYSLNGGAPVVETFNGSLAQAADTVYTFSTNVDLSSLSNYTLVAKVILAGDMNGNNDSLTIAGSVASAASVPLAENFESISFPPANWQSVNPNADGYYWKKSSSVTGSSGNPTYSAYIDNYDNATRGTMDYMYTSLIDFSLTANPQMLFDVSYARYDAGYDDRLTIEVSSDCGSNFLPSGYDKASLALNTMPTQVNHINFAPTSASQWRRDTVSLHSYGGQMLIIRFTNTADYGNNLYIDNINISDSLELGTQHSLDIPMIGVYPNPSYGLFNVNLQNITGSSVNVEVLDMQGKVVSSQRINNSSRQLRTTIDLSRQSKGIYNLRVVTEEKNYHMKLTLM